MRRPERLAGAGAQPRNGAGVRSSRPLLIAALAGAALGLAANALGGEVPWLEWLVAHLARPVGQIFVRLLTLLVVPLLVSALAVGVSELDLAQLRRMGLRLLGYTVAASTVAAALGLLLVNAVGPGRGASEALRELARHADARPAPAPWGRTSPPAAALPDTPVEAVAQAGLVGLIVFSILLGVWLARSRRAAAARLGEAVRRLLEVSTKLVDLLLRLAPLGVGALLCALTARLGADLLRQLAAYVAVVVAGLALHLFGVYSLSVRFLGGMSPRAFFAGSRLAMVTAFSTASSSATLPTALRVAEEGLRLPPRVARFVLTAGSAMNQNGTALFEGVTVLFLAQLFGVEMGLARQAAVMGLCLLAGIGAAGVPAGSIPAMAMVLQLFGIPAEGLGLVLGVDRLLDMCRTTVNVTGDLAAAVYVARGEAPES